MSIKNMQVNRSLYTAVFIILVLVGCGKALSPEKYIAWMKNEKNGLHKIKPVAGIVFDLQYQTPELMALAGKDKEISVEAQKPGIEYWVLSIYGKETNVDPMYYNLLSPDEYTQRQAYFSFTFKNDIEIRTGAKTYPCEFMINMGIPGMQKELRFLLGFDIGQDQGDLTLYINDKIFGGGSLLFKFKKEDIKNIPSLKIKEK